MYLKNAMLDEGNLTQDCKLYGSTYVKLQEQEKLIQGGKYQSGDYLWKWGDGGITGSGDFRGVGNVLYVDRGWYYINVYYMYTYTQYMYLSKLTEWCTSDLYISLYINFTSKEKRNKY